MSPEFLHRLASSQGTPFWIYDAKLLRQRIADILHLTSEDNMQARFAMKSCPAHKILREMASAGIWIDAVSGNEVLRALRAGHSPGISPPVICLTSDVFRDNALAVIQEHGILPNIGSPGMIQQLAEAGYRGPISIRINPGFGHGHVNSCDTGGPSSKHGIWHTELEAARLTAQRHSYKVHMLHAHIGSGPRFQELVENFNRLGDEMASLAKAFPDLKAVSLGGGIPHNYRDPNDVVPLNSLAEVLLSVRDKLKAATGRAIRLEIEPGRYFVAPVATLVTRVTDLKETRTNEKGEGATFAMVDAGFVDLVRPTMYGSFHRISILGKEPGPIQPIVVAGPLCESGDVFTRNDKDEIQPRLLPRPQVGDLLLLHDAGAYGYSMSSNYNSIGRAPQIWQEEDGSLELISRRQTLEDIISVETSQKISLA